MTSFLYKKPRFITFENSYDLIFIQEAPFYHVRNTISTTNETGDPVEGPVYHGAWDTIHKFHLFKDTRVCIYVNWHLLNHYRISLDDSAEHSPNLLIFSLTEVDRFSRTASLACLYNRPGMNNAAVQSLIRALPNTPDLLMIQGDFNLKSPDWNPEAVASPKICHNLMVACTLKGLQLINDDGAPTWHHINGNSSVIDLLFLSDTLLQRTSHDFENDHVNRGPSDHSAFRLRLGSAITREGREYIPKESDEEDAFIDEIHGSFLLAAQNATNTIQEVFDALANSIQQAWAKNCRRSKAGFNPTPWWTNECTAAKAAFELWNCDDPLTPNDPRRADFLQDKQMYYCTIQKAQRAHFTNKLDVMTKTKRPWEGMHWIRLRKPPAYTSIKDSSGDNIKSIDALFNHMHDHFNSTASSDDVDLSIISEFKSFPERDFPAISIAEIMVCLKNTSNTSAPGSDHITWRHIKLIFTEGVSDAIALNTLASLYNRIINEGIWLSQLKEAISVIIPKPKKECYDMPKAFRLIALLKTIGKLLTKVITKRMQFDGIQNDLFHPGQFGGITKHAIET